MLLACEPRRLTFPFERPGRAHHPNRHEGVETSIQQQRPSISSVLTKGLLELMKLFQNHSKARYTQSPFSSILYSGNKSDNPTMSALS